MSRDLYEQRKKEFIEVVKQERNLPKPWQYHFSDREDMRVWFDKLRSTGSSKKFLEEIDEILSRFDKKILTDKEREEEFLECIGTIKIIPMKGEIYFSDNADMYSWYMSYRKTHKDFETICYINLPEYIDFDLVTVWPLIKQDFINTLKTLKRVPDHGEVILQNDIDVRVVYDKLKTHDPVFFEKLLLHLQTYNKKGLSIDDRVRELKHIISTLGYLPKLQEARFTDRTDMFTWYMKYKDKLPNMEEEITSLIYKEPPTTKVNIYFIPNFQKRGGKFYTICSNVGTRLDLSNITSFEEAQKLDPTLVKRGGLILKRDEEIGSVGFGKGKSKR